MQGPFSREQPIFIKKILFQSPREWIHADSKLLIPSLRLQRLGPNGRFFPNPDSLVTWKLCGGRLLIVWLGLRVLPLMDSINHNQQRYYSVTATCVGLFDAQAEEPQWFVVWSFWVGNSRPVCPTLLKYDHILALASQKFHAHLLV